MKNSRIKDRIRGGTVLFLVISILFFMPCVSQTKSLDNEVFRRVKESSFKLDKITANETSDSRGQKTIEVVIEFYLNGKKFSVTAKVPAGVSTGGNEVATTKTIKEALDNVILIAERLKDKGISVLDQFALDDEMRQFDLELQQELLRQGTIKEVTSDLKALGGNTTVGFSMAASRAGAAAKNLPLYKYLHQLFSRIYPQAKLPRTKEDFPLFYILGNEGGMHSTSNLEFQESIIIPDPQKKLTPDKWLEIGQKVFDELGRIYAWEEAQGNITYYKKDVTFEEVMFGFERGYAPVFAEHIKNRTEYNLDLTLRAIRATGYRPGREGDVALAFDVAANTLQEKAGVLTAKEYLIKNKYSPTNGDLKINWYLTDEEVGELLKLLSKGDQKGGLNYLAGFYGRRPDAGYLFEREEENGVLVPKIRTTKWMIDYYQKLVDNYPIISIEDGLSEDDWWIKGKNGWEELTRRLGARIDLVLDDLACTNPGLLFKAIEHGVGNAIIIKVNQIGILTDALRVVALAKKRDYKVVVSHRAG